MYVRIIIDEIIFNNTGTVKWLNNLNWYGKERWHKEKQKVLEIDSINEGYVKQVDNLIFYTILRAGHSVSNIILILMNKIRLILILFLYY